MCVTRAGEPTSDEDDGALADLDTHELAYALGAEDVLEVAVLQREHQAVAVLSQWVKRTWSMTSTLSCK